MLAELDLDLSRLHFTGLLSRPDMVAVMRASDAHVYLTVPFVLSWSLLDAMACGCLLVASDTAPVREFLEDGVTGLLVPPHDVAALVARLETALDGKAGGGLRRCGRGRGRRSPAARRAAGGLAEKLAWLEAAVALPALPLPPARGPSCAAPDPLRAAARPHAPEPE